MNRRELKQKLFDLSKVRKEVAHELGKLQANQRELDQQRKAALYEILAQQRVVFSSFDQTAKQIQTAIEQTNQLLTTIDAKETELKQQLAAL